MAILDFVGGALQGIPQGIQNASNIQKVWQQQDEMEERRAGKPLREKQSQLANVKVDAELAEEARLNEKFDMDKDPTVQQIFKYLPADRLPIYKEEASQWKDKRTAINGVKEWIKNTHDVALAAENFNKEKQQSLSMQFEQKMKEKNDAMALAKTPEEKARIALKYDTEGKAIHDASLSMNERVGQLNVIAALDAFQKTVPKNSETWKEIEASKSNPELAKAVMTKVINEPNSVISAYTRAYGLENGLKKYREDQLREKAAARSHTGSSANKALPLGVQKLIEKSGIDWIAASSSQLQNKIRRAQNRGGSFNYRLLLDSHQTKVLDEYREAYEKLLQAGGTPVQSEMEAKQYIADKYSNTKSTPAAGPVSNSVGQKQPLTKNPTVTPLKQNISDKAKKQIFEQMTKEQRLGAKYMVLQDGSIKATAPDGKVFRIYQ